MHECLIKREEMSYPQRETLAAGDQLKKMRNLQRTLKGAFTMSEFKDSSEFAVLSVFIRAWTVMWKKPEFFLGITLLYSVIQDAVTYMIKGLFESNMVAQDLRKILLSLPLSVIFQAVITYAIFMLLMEGCDSMSESLKRAAGRAVPLISGTVLMFLGLVLTLIASLVLMRISGIFFSTYAVHTIGIIIYVILAVILLCKWFVYIQACIIERIGGFDSLCRSSELTNGYRLKIFVVFILPLCFTTIILLIAGFIVGLITESKLFVYIFSTLITLIPLAYVSIIPTVAYYSLRAAKENLTPDDLADLLE